MSVNVTPPSESAFRAGDVLTCMSDGFPEPTYTWTVANGVVLSIGPNITLTGTHFKLTCTATGNVNTHYSASKTVSDITSTLGSIRDSCINRLGYHSAKLFFPSEVLL